LNYLERLDGDLYRTNGITFIKGVLDLGGELCKPHSIIFLDIAENETMRTQKFFSY